MGPAVIQNNNITIWLFITDTNIQYGGVILSIILIENLISKCYTNEQKRLYNLNRFSLLSIGKKHKEAYMCLHYKYDISILFLPFQFVFKRSELQLWIFVVNIKIVKVMQVVPIALEPESGSNNSNTNSKTKKLLQQNFPLTIVNKNKKQQAAIRLYTRKSIQQSHPFYLLKSFCFPNQNSIR